MNKSTTTEGNSLILGDDDEKRNSSEVQSLFLLMPSSVGACIDDPVAVKVGYDEGGPTA